MGGKNVVMPISFDSERDRRLLEYLNRLPKGKWSETVREILRAHLSIGGDVTLGDVYRAVQDLKRELRTRTIAVGAGCGETVEVEEPPEAAAALDQLGKL